MSVAAVSRRDVLRSAAAVAAMPLLSRAAESAPFRLNYIVPSPMYGTMELAVIVPEVPKTGARHIDIWPKVHGNQREQLEAMGHDRFAELLRRHDVQLGCITRYDLGPFGLQEEMAVCRKLGGSVLVCGSRGPKNLQGDALKQAMRTFVEQMKPHIDAAAKHGVTLAIENHASALLHEADSMRWFAEFTADHPPIGIAFAPHHLPQDAALQGNLIDELGPKVAFFYAQQHGKGSRQTMPKEDELLQMPGRGPLDFAPLVHALKRIRFTGFTAIYMHPYPRGLPILPTAPEITAEINRARAYLDRCVAAA